MWEQTPGQAPVNRLIRNQLTEGRFTEEQAFDLDITAFPGFNIIAVNKDKDYVYVARRNDSDLQLERYDLATGASGFLARVCATAFRHSKRSVCTLHQYTTLLTVAIHKYG